MLAKKVAYNTLVQISGKVLGFVISGYLLVIVADHLGTEGMGNYVTILAFVNFFVTLADLGANLILIKEVTQHEDQAERITGEFLGFRLTFGLLTMMLAPVAAHFVPQYSRLIVLGVLIIALAQFLLLVNQLFVSVLQTRLQLDRATFAELMNRIATLAIILVLSHMDFRGQQFFYGLMYAVLAGSLLNMFITFYFARKLWRLWPRLALSTWKKTVLTVLPMGVFSILGIVHFKADTIILSLLKSQVDVGIYGYAYKIGETIFAFPVMFVGTVFPKLSELLVKDRKRFDELVQITFSILLVGTLPFLTFIFFVAKYLTLLLARNAPADGLIAGNSLQILTVAFFFWFIGTLFIHLLIIANAYVGLIRNLTIAVVCNIVLNLILIPYFSYYGAAAVTLITEAIMFFLTVRHAKNVVGIAPKVTYLGQMLLATLAMGGVMVMATQTKYFVVERYIAYTRLEQMGLVMATGIVGMAVYAAVLYLLCGKRMLSSYRSVSVAS